MKAGKLIADVHTNYELLNRLLKTDYEAWMSAEYKLSNGSFIWMVYLDGKERNGWINVTEGDNITEKYVGGRPYPNNIDTGLQNKTRVVFEKVKISNKQCYIFKGIYELQIGKPELRLLKKISDETDLF